MLPLAPARFSTITCSPSRAGSAAAMRRVVVSAPPPGELGTMQRIGFDGNGCAGPGVLMSKSRKTASSLICSPLAPGLPGAVRGDRDDRRPAGTVAPGVVGPSLDD